MEASGNSRWFERLLSALQLELWIGDAAVIGTKRVHKQKTESPRCAALATTDDGRPLPARIWVADAENRDLRQLL
jgi:hypothetical protein